MWSYLSTSGDVLARVSRPDVPPLGYPVSICGDGGPMRHYIVVATDADAKVLVLAVKK